MRGGPAPDPRRAERAGAEAGSTGRLARCALLRHRRHRSFAAGRKSPPLNVHAARPQLEMYRLQTDGALNVNSQATPIVIGGNDVRPRRPLRGRARCGDRHREMASRRQRRTPWRRASATGPARAPGRRIAHRRPPVHRQTRPVGRWRPGSARTARSTSAFRITRCRSSTTTSSSRGEHAARNAWRDRQPSRVRCTDGAKRWEFSLVPSRATSATTRGRATAGRIASGRTRGRSTSPSTPRAARCTLRWRRRFPAPGAATAAAEPVRQLRRCRRIYRESKWHFQTIHHDLGCRSRRRRGCSTWLQRQAGAGAGADDEVGLPVSVESLDWQAVTGIEERKVAASNVPGERAFPTKPIPVKPPPLGRVTYRNEDLGDGGGYHAGARRRMLGRPEDGRSEERRAVHALAAAGRERAVVARYSREAWGAPSWAGPRRNPKTGFVFAVSQDVGALGGVRHRSKVRPLGPRRQPRVEARSTSAFRVPRCPGRARNRHGDG